MTVVAGIVTTKGIYFASDSIVAMSDTKLDIKTQKLIKLHNYIVGAAGNVEISEFIRTLIANKLIKRTIDSKFTIYDLVNEIKQNFQLVENFTEIEDANILIGCKNVLYQTSKMDNFCVLKVSTKFSAIGSGKDEATGAMYALVNSGKYKPEYIVKTACKCAIQYNQTCGGKIVTRKIIF